jgi:hypothetical protein
LIDFSVKYLGDINTFVENNIKKISQYSIYNKMTNFDQLLTKYSIKKGDSTKHTNTRIGNKKLSLPGGSYHIPDEEYPDFIKSYYNDVIIGNKIEYLTEKQLETGGPLLIDLDFKFNYDLTSRVITTTHIDHILSLYLEELNSLYQIDGPIDAFVFLKDNINRVEDKLITKDGIHMIIAMQCNHNVQIILRERVMAKIKDILGALPLTNTWDDVFDEGISKGGTNWQLCGSRKPANDVYKLVKCYNIKKDPVDDEFMYDPIEINEYYNEDNFFKLSARNKDIPLFFATNELLNLLPNETDIKEMKSSPNRIPTVIIDIDNKYNKMIFELALEQGILDVRAANRLDWINMGWFLKNQFDNIELFDNFSKRDERRGKDCKYNKQDVKDEWNKMDVDTNGLKIGSFIEWIKKDDKLKADIIIKKIAALKKEDKRKGHKQTIKNEQQIACEEHEKEWNDKNPNATFKFMTAKKDIDAGIAVFNHLKDRLVCCSGQIFYKHNNIWLNDIKMIIPCLRVFVLSLPIFKLLANGIIVEYAGDLPNAEKIVKIVMDKVVVEKQDDSFYSKFHTTTKGKLCFVDGVLDFKTKQFYLWDEIQFEYYSTLMINRPFAGVFRNRASNKDIKEVKEKVFDQLFENNCSIALKFIARGIAGHIEDKHWGRYMGNRDCGKGVFGEITQTALQKYTTTINATHFLADRTVGEGDKAKKNSWMIPLQFVRIALTQEMKFDNENKGMKIDGVTIKMFASGGDLIEGRQNYQNEMYFTLACRLIFMCNDIPPIKPVDTLESCFSFQSTKQFKSQSWIDAEEKMMIEQGERNTWEIEKKKYKVGNSNIKTSCQTVEWGNAYILLLLEHYKDVPVTANTTMGDDDDDLNLKRLLIKNFVFTIHKSDFVSTKVLKNWMIVNKVNASFSKLKEELLAEECKEGRTENNTVRGWTGIKMIPKVEIVPPVAE